MLAGHKSWVYLKIHKNEIAFAFFDSDKFTKKAALRSLSVELVIIRYQLTLSHNKLIRTVKTCHVFYCSNWQELHVKWKKVNQYLPFFFAFFDLFFLNLAHFLLVCSQNNADIWISLRTLAGFCSSTFSWSIPSCRTIVWQLVLWQWQSAGVSSLNNPNPDPTS